MQSRNARLTTFLVVGLFLTEVGRGVGHAAGEPPNEANPGAPARPAPAAPPGAAKGRIAGFQTPRDALDAFLNALQARDPMRLAEATSLHAPLEANPANRPLFLAILQRRFSEQELKDLALRLEGYKFVEPSSPKRERSSGQRTLTLMKPGSRSVLHATIRHEKAGWKVLDISLPPAARPDWNVDDLRRHAGWFSKPRRDWAENATAVL
jgi:hypothetical protein